MPIKSMIFLLGLLAGSTVQAVDYIQIAPMNQIVKGTVGNVRDSDSTVVPMITWGGDIATIYGNGNTTLTAKDSILGQLGLNVRLIRQDVFANQINQYLSGETPYLRGTLGMLNQASDVLNQDPRTRPVIIYQLTW
jgi:hypothetical protein